ncbi:MAG TPA: M14 family metallopeptidase [Rubricoccaceae bacterium]|nr:M14 family metallopeptidase [Rubricoccaceae bacterium]
MAFLDALAPTVGLTYYTGHEGRPVTDSRVHVTSFGTSVEGRSLPLAVWGAPAASAEAVLATGKTRVLVFANIHAGEVDGKEAALMLLRDLAMGRHDDWADSLVVLVAPIYNADGNERFSLDNRPLQWGPVGGMGQRPNAQGLDLNRDFVKLAAPETRALVRLMREYDPHVVLDLHTTDGTAMGYHLTYAPPLHPTTDPLIDLELRDRLLPAVTAQVKHQTGWDIWHYGNVPGAFGEPVTVPRGWYSFDPRPRFSTNYVGLRNRLGILAESYSYASFEERIRVTLAFLEAVLDYAAANATRIGAITQALDDHSIANHVLTLRSTLAPLPDSVDVLLGEVDTLRHPATGAPMLARRDVRRPERMPAFIRFAPEETAAAPRAWLVPADLAPVVELLDLHGIRYSRTPQTFETAEAFEIDSVETAARPFQDRLPRTLHGYWGTLNDAGLTNVLVVPADQPLGRLAFLLLEPRSEDGIVAWDVLPEEAYQRGRYPIYRLH